MLSPFHGDRLKTLRTEHGWPQANLADKVGSNARQVSRYEHRRAALITKTKLRVITG
ncbi:MAG: helix-turn-helix domain-containing protein [Propionicimonas sp.]